MLAKTLLMAAAFLVGLAAVFISALLKKPKKSKDGVPKPIKEKKPYTYAEYKQDLYDGRLTLDEIMEKCGGAPPKPPPKEPPPPAALQSRMDWFENASKGKKIRVVQPPVPQLVMKVYPVPCDCDSVMYPRSSVACKKCRGTGTVYIHDGR